MPLGPAVCALCATLVLSLWEYNPEWSSRAPSDLDTIARQVAPDIFELTGSVTGPPYNESYHNPCWHDAVTHRLRCLPSFYVLGGFQCGAVDFARRLMLSPQAAMPKSPWHAFWTSENGYSGDFTTFIKVMDKAAAAVAKHPHDAVSFVANQAALIFSWAEHIRVHVRFKDAFVDCWKKCRKELLPVELSARCKDKKYKVDHCVKLAFESDPASALGRPGEEFTLPQLMLRAHGPRLRVMALVRNPADRLWSAFHYYAQFTGKYGDGPEGMSAYLEEQGAHFHTCQARWGRRQCAMRFEALGQEQQEVFYHCDQLIKGMYSVFVEEWITALTRDHVRIIRSEDYFEPTTQREVLRGALAWAGMLADDDLLDTMIKPKPKPRRTKPGVQRVASWQMPSNIRAQLSAFYQPFNEELAKLLGDETFADWPVHHPATPQGQKHRIL